MRVSRRAYLIYLLGGAGYGAGCEIMRLYRRHNPPFPLRSHATDSDKALRDRPHPFHKSTFIGLQPAELDAMRANFELFGPAAEIIHSDFAEFLHREDVEAGSRARRPLTQLFVAYHVPQLIEDMRQQILQLLNDEDASSIQPILVGSAGGGCGSALVILVAQLLASPESRDQILAGFDDAILRRPIAFVAEPYAMADQNNDIQQSLIYAHAFGFRQEAGYLQQLSQLAEVNLTGLSNSRGVVLKTIQQLHRQLGNAAFWHMLHEQQIESVRANYGFTKYAGPDAPELYSNRNGRSPAAAGNGGRMNP